MALTQLTSPLDIVQVGISWTDTNRAGFLFDGVPQGFMPSAPDNYGPVTYKIPKFDNSFLQSAGLKDWEPGDERTGTRAIGSVDVTVSPRGRSTLEIERAANRPIANRFADLESNISNILLSMLYQGIDKDLVAFLTNASNFGQITITGTADWDDFLLDQAPMWDILSKMIAPLRKYSKSVPGLVVEWWMEDHVADVLSAHWNLFGGGAAVGTTVIQPTQMVHARQALIATIQANLGITVKITGSVTDTALYGQTSSPQEIAYGLCWVGVVDRRASRWDIMSADVVKPDGAIQIAMSRDPEVVNFIVEGSEVETFVGRTSYEVFSPRGSDWGFLVPVSDIIS